MATAHRPLLFTLLEKRRKKRRKAHNFPGGGLGRTIGDVTVSGGSGNEGSGAQSLTADWDANTKKGGLPSTARRVALPTVTDRQRGCRGWYRAGRELFTSSQESIATGAAALNPLATDALSHLRELLDMAYGAMEQLAELDDHLAPARGIHAPLPQHGVPFVGWRVLR